MRGPVRHGLGRCLRTRRRAAIAVAEQAGAVVKEQHAVREVLFEGDRAVGVSFVDRSTPGAKPVQEMAPWVVDATGQSCLLNRQLKDNCYNDPVLDDKISVYSHWEYEPGDLNGADEMNFKLCVHANGTDWIWFLPIGDNLVSIGLVVEKHSLKQRGRDLESFFNDYAEEVPFIKDFMKRPDLKRTEKFRGVKDFSYRSKEYYGPGWALTGDSAGFLDPIFSTGLQITFNSSIKLAEVLDAALEPDAPPIDELFEDYKNTLKRVYRVNATLVYLFYRFGIDPVKIRKNANIVTKTEWANWRILAKFLWNGIRLHTHSAKVRTRWGREVLFGSPSPGNRVADALYLLAENFETLHWRKMENPESRLNYNEAT